MLKLLIVEGNTREGRDLAEKAGSLTQSNLYEKTIRFLREDADCTIAYPADVDHVLPAGEDLEQYDGIIWTGSSLNIYDNDTAITRQIDFMKECFKRDVKIFGSCWGLQVAVVATGGQVVKNARGREVGIARNIVTTEDGKHHPLYKNKRGPFDANAIHLDHVEELPPGAVVLSGNEISEVQAVEIKRGNAVFWGVQYHPEFDLEYMAFIVRKYKKMLVDEKLCADDAAAEKLATDFLIVHNDPGRKDIAEHHQMGPDILDPCCRLQEIENWLDFIEPPMH
tara:strand:- start:139788 stop:140630 length:843 start_codon:yes stop_codon:yes gene_type:complete